MKNIHIGEIIKAKVAERKMSVKELSQSINCDRTNIYKIYKRKSIDIEQLLLISKALNYNFIEEIYFASNKEKEDGLFSDSYTIEVTQDVVRVVKKADKESVVVFRKEREG